MTKQEVPMAKNDQSHRDQSRKDQDPKKEAQNPRPGKNDLYIELLGTSFSITAEEEPAYLEAILHNYRMALASIQESTGLRDPLKLTILTGFLLCDKIQRMYLRETPESNPADTQEAEQITLGLINRINSVLESGR
ncbi:MAG: cell division protein ZapA [Spirochaetaceae bacterium]|jgi:cell division protein ZapA (FtsZ GTPase activity inhibitor)|nr:cell division protein ZapA [Spirochaetaceae bacterium]